MAGSRCQQAPGQLGPIVPVEVWLDADVEQPDTFAVHIGGTRVGPLSGDATRRFAPDVEATHYDELVFTSAQLTTTQLHTEPTLQLRLPPQL